MRGNKTEFISLHGYISKKEIVINTNVIVRIFHAIDDKGLAYTSLLLNGGDTIKVVESIEYIKKVINCYE